MSTVERNKGVIKYLPIDTENFTREDFDEYRENGFMVLGDEIFKVDYEVKRELDCSEFCELQDIGNGSYSFHTLHYNGSGSLEEVLESVLSKL